MAQVELVFNLLYNIGQHLVPRTAAVPVPHVPARPPEQTVYDLAGCPGPPQRIGEGMASRTEALALAPRSDAVKPPRMIRIIGARARCGGGGGGTPNGSLRER
jgi:hypothetical protein